MSATPSPPALIHYSGQSLFVFEQGNLCDGSFCMERSGISTGGELSSLDISICILKIKVLTFEIQLNELSQSLLEPSTCIRFPAEWPIAYGKATGALSRTAEKQNGEGERLRINQDNHGLVC